MRGIRAMTAGLAAAFFSVASVSGADAMTYRGATCGSGGGEANHPCLVLYYNSDNAGASAHFYNYNGISDLAGYTYPSNGAGQGQAVKNNAASAAFWSLFTDETALVYYYSNYGGPCDSLPTQSGTFTNATPRLKRTYNENASIKVISGMVVGDCYQWT